MFEAVCITRIFAKLQLPFELDKKNCGLIHILPWLLLCQVSETITDRVH